MPKLCKRIIALLLAFCLVCFLCFSAFAVTSENQATFWEAWLAYLAGMNDNTGIFDGWGGNDFIGNLVSPDTVCPESSDGYHHGTQVDGLVDGRAKVKCSECGQWFYYSASDLENQYTDSLHDSGLDNGLSVTPPLNGNPSGFVWYPTFDDIDISRSYLYNWDDNVYLYRLPLSSYNTSHFTDEYFHVNGRSIEFGFSSFTPDTGYLWFFGSLIYFIIPVSGAYYLLNSKESDLYNSSNYGDSYFSYKNMGHYDVGSLLFIKLDTASVNGSGPCHGKYYFPEFRVEPDSSSSPSSISVPYSITLNDNDPELFTESGKLAEPSHSSGVYAKI